MKPAILTFTLFITLSLVSAQEPEAGDGRKFLKRIENNYRNNVKTILPNGQIEGDYNLSSKSAVEKLFLGEFNAEVEFFLAPSFEGASGMRIYRDSTDKHVLEVKKSLTSKRWTRL